MKKLLALVLAVVMTLGLATVGASAAVKSAKDYTDYSSLEDTDSVYEQAVEVISTIGVMGGKDNGDFGFKDELKRSEGATIIARMLLGETISKQLEAQTSSEIFTSDMSNHWAAGYVDYLAKAGIVAGKGKDASGKDMFDPDGNLTKVEFGKMLLTALGYDQYMEGLVGIDWAVNTSALIAQNDIWAGDDEPTGSMTINRQEAALHAYNTLQAPMVSYDNAGRREYVTASARDSQTISSATVNDGSARGTYMVEFAEHYYPSLIRNTHDKDTWGRPATTWTLNRETISKRVNKELLVLASTEAEDFVTGEAVFNALGGSSVLGDKGSIGRYGNNNSLFGQQVVFYNDGKRVDTNDGNYTYLAGRLITNGDKIKRQNANFDYITGYGVQFEVYLDNDSYQATAEGQNANIRVPTVTIVTIHTYLAKAADNYNSSTKKMNIDVYTREYPNGLRVVNEAGWVLPESPKTMENYKQGDYMLVNVNYATDTDAKKQHVEIIRDATVLSNVAITAYTRDTSSVSNTNIIDYTKLKTLTTGGTKYNVAVTAEYEQELMGDGAYTLETLNGYTYNVYLNQESGGIVMGAVRVNKSDNFVFVSGLQNDAALIGGFTYRGNMIFTNGNMRSGVTVNTASNGSARTWLNGNTNLLGRWDLNTWFTYSQDGNGNITLIDVIPGAGTWTLSTVNSTSYRQTAINRNAAVNNYSDTLQIVPAVNSAAAALGTARPGDDTKFVTVSLAANIASGVRQIDRVNGTWTGIRGTQIIPTTTEFNAHPITGVANANVFYIYNVNGYIEAAIVATGRNVTRNLLYTTYDGLTGRSEYDSARYAYLDSYKVIVPGESAVVTKQINSGTTSTIYSKLESDALYDVSYDANGYIEYLTPVEDVLPQFVMTRENADAKYGMFLVDHNRIDEITVGGDNVIAARRINNNGVITTIGSIRTTATGNFFVQRTADSAKPSKDYYRFATANDAYNYAIQGGYSIAEVYAMCSSSGWADTVVFRAGNNAAYLTRLAALADLRYTYEEYTTEFNVGERSRAARWGAWGAGAAYTNNDTQTVEDILNIAYAAILASNNVDTINALRLAAIYDLMAIDGKYAASTTFDSISIDGVVYDKDYDYFRTNAENGWTPVVLYRKASSGTTTNAAPTTAANANTGYTVWNDANVLLNAYKDMPLKAGDSIRIYFMDGNGNIAATHPNGTYIMIGEQPIYFDDNNGTVIDYTGGRAVVTGNTLTITVNGADDGALTIDLTNAVADNRSNQNNVVISPDVNGNGVVTSGTLNAGTIGNLTVKSGVLHYELTGDQVQVITGNLTVEGGANLTIDVGNRNNPTITVNGSLDVQKGSLVDASANGVLTIKGGATLMVDHSVNVDGDLFIESTGMLSVGNLLTGAPLYVNSNSLYNSGTLVVFGNVEVSGELMNLGSSTMNVNIASTMPDTSGKLTIKNPGSVTVAADATLNVEGSTVFADGDFGVTPSLNIANKTSVKLSYWSNPIAGQLQPYWGTSMNSQNLLSVYTVPAYNNEALVVADIVAAVNNAITNRNLGNTINQITAADVFAVNATRTLVAPSQTAFTRDDNLIFAVKLTNVGGGPAPAPAGAVVVGAGQNVKYSDLIAAGTATANPDSITVDDGGILNIDTAVTVAGDVVVNNGSQLNVNAGGSISCVNMTYNGTTSGSSADSFGTWDAMNTNANAVQVSGTLSVNNTMYMYIANADWTYPGDVTTI